MARQKGKKKAKAQSGAKKKVHSDFSDFADEPVPEVEVFRPEPEPKPEPEPVEIVEPTPKPKPVETGDQVVMTGSFGGQQAVVVLSKTTMGYDAHLIRLMPAGPLLGPPTRFADEAAALRWVQSIMAVSTTRRQAQVPVSEVVKGL